MKKTIQTLFLLLCMMAMLCLPAYAANPTFEEAFPDPAFRAYVTDEVLASNTEDKGDAAEITEAQMEIITVWNQVNVSNQGISSLQGIGYFTNLYELWCDRNSLTELDVSGCIKLANLYCGSNRLAELNISNCANLQRLHCDYNNLTELDVSNCTNLIDLGCYNNSLAELDISNCTNLEGLHCDSNSLTELDVSNCTNLQKLNCSVNSLAELDVSSCTNLLELWCHKNGLTELDVSGCRNLTKIHCTNNNLTDLDLRNNSNLTSATFNSQTPTKTDVPVIIEKDGTYTLDMEAFLGESGSVDYVTMTDGGVLENGTVTYTTEPTTVTYTYDTGMGDMDVTWEPIFAEAGPEIIAEGTINSGAITWKLDEDGLLTFEGTGAIPGYSSNSMPWSIWIAKIKTVQIGDGITGVGAYAFIGHTELESVHLGRAVTSIGNQAFANCLSLTEITISDKMSVAHADGNSNFAFANTPITTVYVPATVKSIPQSFLDKLSIAYFDAEGDGVDGYFDVDGVLYHRDEYTGTQTLVKAPSSMDLPNTFEVYEGTTVIGSRAAIDNDSFICLDLPNGLQTIGAEAFEACDYLVSVDFADAITEIGEKAFYHCDRLICVELPDTTTSIGANAFNTCGYLEEVHLGRGVTWLGNQAFANCPDLTKITVSDKMSMAHADGNSNFAFYDTPITTVYVPATVKSIPLNFYDISTIAEFIAEGDGVDGYFDVDSVLYHRDEYTGTQTLVKIPHSMDLPEIYEVYAGTTVIGTQAADNNDSFAHLVLCDGLQVIGANAFEACDYLLSVDFADAVTEIGDAAFYHCDRLMLVDLPDTTTSIGVSAFAECGYLEEVKLGCGVTWLGNDAFTNCTKLTKITVSDKMSMAHADGNTNFAFYNTPITTVYVPATVETIPQNFYDKATIAYFDADGTGEQGYFDVDGVLYHKNKTTGIQTLVKAPHSVDLPDTYKVYEGTTVIGEKAFYNNDSFAGLLMCDGLQVIGANAFEDCDNLITVDFAYAVTTIGEAAFHHCDWLMFVNLPDTTASIGVSAFAECGKLEKVWLGSGVTSLGSKAFAACPMLTEISISDNMSMAHADGNSNFAFYNTPITTVYVPATVETIPQNFYEKATIAYFDADGTGEQGYFDVDGVLYHKDKYTGTQTLLKVPHSMDLPNTFEVYVGTTVIGEKAVYNNDTLENIKLPDGLLTIGLSAFYDCDNLLSLVVPDTVTVIGETAFHHTDWLSEVHIGSGITSIGRSAFDTCPKLTHIFFRGDGTNISLGRGAMATGAEGFAVWYPEDAAGWSTPTWNDYAAYPYALEDDFHAYRINSITVSTLSGETLGEIPESVFHVTVSVTNQVADYNKGAIMVAAYTADGQFCTWNYIAMEDCPSEATVKFTMPIDNTDGDVGILRAFVTDGTGSMIPLGNAVEFAEK